MKNIVIPVLLVFVCIIFQGCQHANHSTKTGDVNTVDTAKMDSRLKLENEIQTAMFIERAAMDDMLKVELGKLAVEKASSPGVRSLGKLILRDHRKIDDALKALAVARGLKLSNSLTKKDLEQVQQMSEMKANYFEKLYIKMMIEGYNKDIELFESARNSPDTAINNFARKFLPMLEMHRENAVQVRSGLIL